MATTLEDLLATVKIEEIVQTLLGVYQAAGFPVQSWQEGGTELTRLLAMATGIKIYGVDYIPVFARGVILDYSTGNWLTLLAAQHYNLDRISAQFTVGDIKLTAAAGVGTQTFAAGTLIAVFAATGNRYINNATIIVPVGLGTVTGSFTAEKAGASYNDPSSSGAISLVTPIPGVTLTNPAGTYSAVAHVGAGTGTLTLTGSPTAPHQVVVRIDATGQSGVAVWSYSLDGATWVSAGAAASLAIGSTGITVTLTNVDSPSFIIGDTYTFQTPGSWITSQGANEETDDALRGRCRARWTTLSLIGTQDLYQLLVKATPGSGSQVTQIITQPDININNKLNIILAGPGGVLPAGVISDVQVFLNKRVPGTVRVFVASPGTLNVTLAAQLTCDASLLAAVQAAAQTAMTNYILSVPINGVVKVAKIIDLLMSVAGVTDVSGVTINTLAQNLDLGATLGTFKLASLQPLSFTYVTEAAA